MPSGIQVFASIRNPDAPSQPAARPRTAIRLLFGEARHLRPCHAVKGDRSTRGFGCSRQRRSTPSAETDFLALLARSSADLEGQERFTTALCLRALEPIDS